MPAPSCPFVWYELLTDDPASAATFYGKVTGWRAADSGMPGLGHAYTILSTDRAPMGGLMALPREAADAGLGPSWIGYVGVPEVDDFAARVTAAGGKIHRQPDDIPGVGRFAVAADPQGAIFNLFKGAPGPERPEVPAGSLGHTGWHELHAADGERAFPFYADLLGWTKAEAIDMGDMGLYQIFSISGTPAGGMMTDKAATPRPFWLFYFNVDEINAAAARVAASGGKILHGPHEVPGGSWIVTCTDPQGARFALVARPHGTPSRAPTATPSP